MTDISCDENIGEGETCISVTCKSTYITSSNRFREVECPVTSLQTQTHGIVDITCVSIKQLVADTTACVRHPESHFYGYGYTPTAIWVKFGCQAEFKVCYEEDINIETSPRNVSDLFSSEHTTSPSNTEISTNTDISTINEVSTRSVLFLSTSEYTPSQAAEAMTSEDDHTTEIAVGVSVGVVVLALILFVAMYCWCKRRKPKIQRKDIQVVVKNTSSTASPDAYDFIDEESIKPRYFINKDLVSVPLPPSSNLVGFSVDGEPLPANTRTPQAIYSTPVLETDRHDNMAFEYDSLNKKTSSVEIITDELYDVSQDTDVYNKLHEHERKDNVIPEYLYDKATVKE